MAVATQTPVKIVSHSHPVRVMVRMAPMSWYPGIKAMLGGSNGDDDLSSEVAFPEMAQGFRDLA